MVASLFGRCHVAQTALRLPLHVTAGVRMSWIHQRKNRRQSRSPWDKCSAPLIVRPSRCVDLPAFGRPGAGGGVSRLERIV